MSIRTGRQSLYIDLGTENTLIYERGRGWILNEPSFVTFRKTSRSREVLASGKTAKSHLGRTPDNVHVERPLRDGVISDFYATETMLRNFLAREEATKFLSRREMIISLPCKVTEYERQAVEQVGRSLGASRVRLIDEPMAAAVGAGLAVTMPSGQVVVDIGGGTTEIAVISLGGVAYANAVRTGGHTMDERIVQHLRNRFDILIGEATAERLKIHYADAVGGNEEMMEFNGVNLLTGLPKRMSLPAHEIHLAIRPVLDEIFKAVHAALSETPPELAADIWDNGIWLAGGGALIKRLPQRMAELTGLRVHVAKDPLFSVARGGAYLLDHPEILEKVG